MKGETSSAKGFQTASEIVMSSRFIVAREDWWKSVVLDGCDRSRRDRANRLYTFSFS